MAIVNEEDGFSQLTKLNLTEKLLVKGDPVLPISFKLLEGQVVKYDEESGTLVYSGATVNPNTGVWTFDKTIEVPAASVAVGEVVTLSEGSTELIISNNVNEIISTTVTSNLEPSGALKPSYFNLGAEFTFTPQGNDSEVITTNPIMVTTTGMVVAPNVRQINQTIFRADAPMSNLVAEIRDQASGVVIKYIPSKAAWEASTPEERLENPGLDFIAGDNVIDYISKEPDSPGVFNLGVSPFRITQGQLSDITIKADTMSLKGVSGIPYLSEMVQDGPEVSVLDENEFSNISDNQIPKKDSSGKGFIDSALTEFAAEIVSTKALNLPGGGALQFDNNDLSSGGTISGGATGVRFKNLTDDSIGYLLSIPFTDVGGTSTPIYDEFQPIITVPSLSDISEERTANPPDGIRFDFLNPIAGIVTSYTVYNPSTTTFTDCNFTIWLNGYDDPNPLFDYKNSNPLGNIGFTLPPGYTTVIPPVPIGFPIGQIYSDISAGNGGILELSGQTIEFPPTSGLFQWIPYLDRDVAFSSPRNILPVNDSAIDDKSNFSAERILSLIDDTYKNIIITQLGTSSTNADYFLNPQTLISEVVDPVYDLGKVTFSFESSNTSTNRSTIVAILIDGLVVDFESDIEQKDNRNNVYQCKVFDYDFSSGPYTMEVRWGRANGGGSALAEISNARIYIEEIRL